MSENALTACSDETLFAKCCRGDATAFGVLVRRYERELYGYLRRYLGDASLADDVFQKIASVARQVETERLKPIFIALEEKVSYDEIRIAVAFLTRPNC